MKPIGKGHCRMQSVHRSALDQKSYLAYLERKRQYLGGKQIMNKIS